jgi:predicted nucleic acid-binding protein
MSSDRAEAERAPTAVDSSVLVAALRDRHHDHQRCRQAVHDLLERGSIILPEPALIETYSVLTRLPPPLRLSPEIVLRLLRDTFSEYARLAPFPAGEVWSFLASAADRQVAGGATYDDRILFSALASGAHRLLTLNVRDFDRLAQGRIEVVSP